MKRLAWVFTAFSMTLGLHACIEDNNMERAGKVEEVGEREESEARRIGEAGQVGEEGLTEQEREDD